jgi:hypothetical protein
MPARTTEPCIRCREQIEISDAAVIFRISGRSAGIQNRLESGFRQVYICVECAIAIAMGDEPPKTQPLNMIAYEIICEMTAESPAIVIAAWQQLRKRLELPPGTPNIVEVLPPAQPLRLAKSIG